ncbi:MAG: hypothetical protein WEA99_05315 [Brumimicrobium sp.]
MQIIHSNSAKVWVAESILTNGEETAKQTNEFKKTFIFYEDGEFIEQELNHLASFRGKKGKYILTLNDSHQDTLFKLYYNDKSSLYFHVKECDSDLLKLHELDVEKNSVNSIWTLRTLSKL